MAMYCISVLSVIWSGRINVLLGVQTVLPAERISKLLCQVSYPDQGTKWHKTHKDQLSYWHQHIHHTSSICSQCSKQIHKGPVFSSVLTPTDICRVLHLRDIFTMFSTLGQTWLRRSIALFFLATSSFTSILYTQFSTVNSQNKSFGMCL